MLQLQSLTSQYRVALCATSLSRPYPPPRQAADPLDELRPVAARINALFPTWEAVMRVPAGEGGVGGGLMRVVQARAWGTQLSGKP